MTMTQGQIEQRARAIWEQEPEHPGVTGVARKYGFTQDEIIGLDWHDLPEAVRDDLREIAGGGA